MRMNEVNMDIMSAPRGFYLLNTISGDFVFNYGLPKAFDDVYDISTKLKKYVEQVNALKEEDEDDGFEFLIGDCHIIADVINVVIKGNCRDKFLDCDLMSVIEGLKNTMDEFDIHKVALPKILTGANGMSWEKVKAAINYVFFDTDVEFLVCVK